jgi:hypothetical protein
MNMRTTPFSNDFTRMAFWDSFTPFMMTGNPIGKAFHDRTSGSAVDRA